MILKRLKEYIDSKGISISAFEKSIGMSNASFGKSLKNNGAIGSDKLEKILMIYEDISPEWLLTGKGDMLRKKSPHLLPEDQETLREICESIRKENMRLKEKIEEKDKQLGELIKTNLMLLEREKEGPNALPGSDVRCADVG